MNNYLGVISFIPNMSDKNVKKHVYADILVLTLNFQLIYFISFSHEISNDVKYHHLLYYMDCA